MKFRFRTTALAAILCHASVGFAAESARPIEPIGFTVKPLLEASETFTGQPLRFPQGDNQLTAVLAEIAPGGQSGRHMHPVPLFVHILEGTLTIEMEGHGVHTFTAGQSLAEVTNIWHNGRNLGKTPVRFLIVFVGQKGTPNLVRP